MLHASAAGAQRAAALIVYRQQVADTSIIVSYIFRTISTRAGCGGHLGRIYNNNTNQERGR